MRPAFEPHPRFISSLSDQEIRDVVLVTTTDLPDLGSGSRRQRSIEFLERQMSRLLGYRRSFVSTCIPIGVRFHGWLWDCEQGSLLPYDRLTRALDTRARVALSREDIAGSRAALSVAATWRPGAPACPPRHSSAGNPTEHWSTNSQT